MIESFMALGHLTILALDRAGLTEMQCAIDRCILARAQQYTEDRDGTLEWAPMVELALRDIAHVARNPRMNKGEKESRIIGTLKLAGLW